jgi:hypothetical protein
MAPKKTRKPIQKTMVEEPTQDLDIPSKAIREEEQEDFVTIVYVLVGKSYFHHQITYHHHYHKFMISTRPFANKLVHNFEVFPFKT